LPGTNCARAEGIAPANAASASTAEQMNLAIDLLLPAGVRDDRLERL